MISRWFFAETLPTWALFLEILIAGFIVVLLASRLTRLADRLSDEFNLGKAWIGLLLLATVTSLPEVVTGSTAVAIGNANMAFATLFGSCSFNLVLIVLLNAFIKGGSVLRRATNREAPGPHVLTSSFGIILLALALIGISLVDKFHHHAAAAQTCEVVIVLIIAVSYIAFVRLTYNFDRANRDPLPPEPLRPSIPRTPGLGRKIALISVLLVIASWWLTKTGDVLAVHRIELIGRPLGASFVGAAFLALATSLPEVVTCLAAVKLGHLDMALGNIFGSNMFNMLVIPFLKVVSVCSGQSLLMAGPAFNALTATIAGLLPVLLTAITVASLTYRTERRILRFGYDSVLLAVVYAIGMYVLFTDGA